MIIVALVSPAATATVAGAQSSPGAGNPGTWNQPPPPVRLTPEEHELLRRGEIDQGQHILGGFVGTFFGFGIGHAVQGRYTEDGWLFTVGEGASFGFMIYGFLDCVDRSFEDEEDCSGIPLIGGALALVGFRIWELIDVWTGPLAHNRKVRALRYRLGYPPPSPGWSFSIVPTGTSSVSAGLTVRF